MFGKEKLIDLILLDVIDKYLDEVGSEYGRMKCYFLFLIKKLLIVCNIIIKIKLVYLVEYVVLRKGGILYFDFEFIVISIL